MKYQIEVQINRAEGSQIFEIEAESEEEAIAGVKNGEGEIIEDQIEVTELSWSSAHIISSEQDDEKLQPSSDTQAGESKTPETDAVMEPGGKNPPSPYQWWVDITHARKLERQRNEARSQLTAAREALEYEIKLASKQVELLELRIEEDRSKYSVLAPFRMNLVRMIERLKATLTQLKP